MRYVTWGNGTAHIKKDGTKTVCGRLYRQYDYYTFPEEELDPNCHAVCHKCSGKRREGPRTISEAMGVPYERRSNQ